MAVAEWSDNGDYYVWRGEVWIPKNFDPNSRAAVIMLGPAGGTAMIPALVQGDPGQPFTPRNVILNELAWDDPTPASASWITVTEATDTTPAVMDLSLTLHAGEPGDDGTMTILGASDLSGTPTAGYTFAVKSDLSGVELVAPRVGGMWWPAAISSTALGAGDNRQLAAVTVPAQPWAWRPRVTGQCIITGEVASPDLRVDLVCRTNQSSEIVGRTYGPSGSYPINLPVISGPPTGSASTYGDIPAGTIGVVYLRTEKQAGTNDYTTSNTTTTFCVEVAPVP